MDKGLEERRVLKGSGIWCLSFWRKKEAFQSYSFGKITAEINPVLHNKKAVKEI